MRKYLAIACLIFSWMNLSAQKSPYHIRNFKASEFGGFNQTWQCQQDSSGLIYIASTTAVYTYDGTRWYPTVIRRGAATRQIFLDSLSGTMYVGSVSDLGCLERDSTGLWMYRSFVDQLTPEQKVFTDIWEIHQVGKRIYAQSSERIFVIEDKKVIGTIEPWEGKSFALMFKCGERLFVRQRTIGMMEIKDLNMTKVPNSDMFATERLLGMMEYKPDTVLMLTGDHGFVKFGGTQSGNTSFHFFTVPNDTFLTSTAVLGCGWINDHEFAVNSRIGLMIYSRDFVPEVLFNKKSGLPDESIAEFYVDREKNIWLTHNDGCSMISYNVPAVTYTDQSGFTGSLETILFKNDSVYLATSEGLFIAPAGISPRNPVTFSRADMVLTEAWDILDAGDVLLLSTSQGVFESKGKKTKQVTTRYTNEVRPTADSVKYITAEKGGISVLRHNHSGFYVSMSFDIPGMEFMRPSVIEPVNGDTAHYSFWCFTRFKSIVHFDLNLRDSTIDFREYSNKNGLPLLDYYPVKIGDSIYFCGYFNAYRYISALDKNDSSLCLFEAPDIYFLLRNNPSSVYPGGFNYSLFLERNGAQFSTFFGNDGNGIYSRRVLLGELISEDNIQYGIIQGDSLLWLLKKQELLHYDLRTPIDTNISFYALVCNVKFGSDSVGNFFPHEQVTIPYASNSVIFQFAAPYFLYSMSVQFQYKLEGYDENWSKYTKTAEKEYTNLPEGTYTFVVRAQNAFNMTSEEARYTFTILPPWYRTTAAYFGYAIVFILLLFITIRISARTLRKQKERLEQTVKERTAEVVLQKQQIEKQKSDLEEAYTGIQDSIHYSQRIQHAILPTVDEIKRIVPDSFVLFFPRDIVSGDFYWFTEKNGLKYIACVDCTGHGVPGALMSMIGNTILNQIILEKGITSPDEILNHLHIGVRQALKQDAGGDTRDGMDLSLIVIDEKSKSLKYAGANRNLWVVRKGELLEIKADKFPIAGSQQEETRRFTAHTIPFEKNDAVYLTTDGYADQFGGDKGKKFMVKHLSRILKEISQLPLDEQKTVLEQRFRSWKGNHEQVDDVLVIGIRL